MQFRTTRPRLAAAVTAVLTVTALGAGTLATAPAAFAATSGPVEAAQAEALPVLPAGSSVTSGGSTGFLSYGDSGLIWTPFDGGPATPVDLGGYEYPGWMPTGSDVVAVGSIPGSGRMTAVTLRDMRDQAAPLVEIDLAALDAHLVAVLGPKTVLAETTKDGVPELHVVTQDGAAPTTRKITDLPADADRFYTSATVQSGRILVGYETGPVEARTGGRAVIDIATGRAIETYASAESGYMSQSLAFSRSHVAWTEWQNGSRVVTSVERSTGVRKTTVMGPDDEYSLALIGDWLVYGNDWRPGRAVSLTDGRTVDLADSVTGLVMQGSSSALLSGRTAEGGAGLFRLDPRTDDAPAVTKVAEVDPSEPLDIQQVHVPYSVNLDSAGGKVTLGWDLSRRDAYLDVTLHHTVTEETFHTRVQAPEAGNRFSFVWDGTLDDGTDAPNGRYAIEAEASLLDGTGEPAYQGWEMYVSRTANPHDFTYNGSTDLLARDAGGVLWRDDLRDRPVDGQVKSAKRTRIGGGWNTYKQIEAVGDIGGNEIGDLVALDGSGVLWSYAGEGYGTFGTRVKVGGGWGVYNKLTGGSDLDGDGRSDLLATDGSGVLWFYKGTGDLAKPFATRVRVGGGWGVYNQLVAVGNIAGTAAGDLVARDTSGVLWLYQGTGKGTFLARTKIGGGWGAFSQLVGAGDVDNDGRPDLIAYGTGGTYVYHANGTVSGTFTRLNTTLYAGEGGKFTSVA
ncbi:FG-GAP-like repeat-containing protein [Streptomyces sp. NPDC058955]|uniref:FG-GAP repeat domain-containing protein n=1 Tax=Streptomyces sp. NPDC058955 TaxID=3346678 RepID=UPI0036889EC5